ncbi:Hypothetical protein LUCI_1602 [Lucifera butyrica]|uniref:Uncharacterized protein n=1 Tax=Lucifera butyrica TaxID=1351585 RepID=A0A498R4K5_9FIRM|nr:hypothetical protein [Lucifera butyrica]VBB06371.1 Hypothetical protein LUCI_1602 [Lucifera butyrica]
MVIRTSSTLALYCHHCGKIQLHDVSLFTLRGSGNQRLFCSCGCAQADISAIGHHQYLLNIPCVLCETNHLLCLDNRKIWRVPMEKIYCSKENLELGLIGERQAVEQMIEHYKQACEDLFREANYDEDDVDDPQLMFEMLNQLHDIAEKGGLQCSCGSIDIEAQVFPECIDLWCRQCGGHLTVRAGDEADLARIKALKRIELIPPRRFHHKT